MEHVVTSQPEPFRAMGGALEVHTVPVGQDNLSYVAVCTASGMAAVVDGPEAGAVLDYCERRGIRLGTILNTHTHGDHVGINADLAQRGQLERYRVVGPKKVASDVPGITEEVEEGNTVSLGDLSARVFLTEGHIDGHVSYLFGDVLFSGDTLFTGGCGYLFDGPAEAMFRSLLRLAQLPDDTRVCCGHEYTQDNLRFAWTIEPDNEALAARIRKVWEVRARGGCCVPSRMGEEKATNPFLRPGSPTIVSLVQRVFPELDFSNPALVFAAVRRLKDTKRYRGLEDGKLPL